MENKPEKCATCKPLTNGDKIRGMSDNELAEYLGNVHYCPDPSFCDPTINCNDLKRMTPLPGGGKP